MPNNNILLKSFNLFFSKFQCLPTITFSPPTTIDDDEQPQKFSPTTTIAEPAVLFNNFNSLHDANSNSSSATQLSAANDFSSSFHSFESGGAESLPDFTSAVASHRFFFSSPGSSNSIFELPLPVPKAPPQMKEYSGGVAVLRYSEDPYGDFRESMMEMIEARGLTELQVEVDWEFLHELLFCYLTLNPKHAHNFIISAFVDVIISLLLPPDNDTRPKL